MYRVGLKDQHFSLYTFTLKKCRSLCLALHIALQIVKVLTCALLSGFAGNILTGFLSTFNISNRVGTAFINRAGAFFMPLVLSFSLKSPRRNVLFRKVRNGGLSERCRRRFFVHPPGKEPQRSTEKEERAAKDG